MDPQVEDQQQEEIIVLKVRASLSAIAFVSLTPWKSIYEQDFIEVPPPKAWKVHRRSRRCSSQAAPRLPEFKIRVTYPDPKYAEKIYFHLHIKLPKTYPNNAPPIFTIQQPIVGLRPDEISKLTHAIHDEVQQKKGEEMVFQTVCFAKEWMEANVKPPVEVSGSLATEMNRRAVEEERVRKQREEEEAALKKQHDAEYAEKLNEQIRENVQRQQLERERFQQARKRAMSDATEVPLSEDAMPTESFDFEIKWQGQTFRRVRLFHPRQECLGTIYQADPICDEPLSPLPLELLSITFVSHYYTTTQGRKKLKQVETELQRLVTIRHQNLLAILAAKLTTPSANSSPRLIILMEKRPSMTLYDLLEDSDGLREERATEYLTQILSALHIVHHSDIVHRGLNLRCIGLAPREGMGTSKIVKLFKVGYHVRLLDLHRSDPFGFNVDVRLDEDNTPEGWRVAQFIHIAPPLNQHLFRMAPVESKLDYTKARDIHSAGIVLLQMLLGRDVMERFSDPQSALHTTSISPFLATKAAAMLSPAKKSGVTCQTLLMDLVSPPCPSANNRTPTIPFTGPKTPLVNGFAVGSPETDYFRMPPPTARHSSRWKEDWEELEILGRGGFGQVVKARNKIDNRIYAVKKIKLRDVGNDKIFREVSALSRLNHRFIVRYYTTWVETSDGPPSHIGSESEDSEQTEETNGRTSKPRRSSDDFNGHFTTFDIKDLDSISTSRHSTFPSIRFARSSSQQNDDDNGSSGSESDDGLFDADGEDDDGLDDPFGRTEAHLSQEFVERQTLRERIAEGLEEEDAWRLFQQILDALVHISSLGILHRDIKLTNIFVGETSLTLDAKGDCKVGDFGLATESLDAVDPSDKPREIRDNQEITMDVGTRLYMAPEMSIQTSDSGMVTPRTTSKADMYSLGIVFFEMNYFFKTDSERNKVIPELRLPSIVFPSDWDPKRSRQRQIITMLLQHDPDKRPSALQLSQSPLLPARVEDEYVKGALNMIAKADSPHLPAVLSTLFTQPVKPVRSYLYDIDSEPPEHASLNSLVIDHLEQIFHLHGAVDSETPLLMPVTNPVEDDHNRAVYLDRHGEVVSLPHNALPPFARAAARAEYKRIKRYHICDIYRPNSPAGHPRASKVAVFDIITPDLVTGPNAAAAEGIAIVNNCLDVFGDLSEHYVIVISHSKILETVLERVPAELRAETIDMLTNTKSSASQKRNSLIVKGVSRSVCDELKLLAETSDDTVDGLVERLEKSSPILRQMLEPYLKDIRHTLQFVQVSGVVRPIRVDPLLLGHRNAYFANGVCFMAVRKNKRTDVLAAGGRYDHVIKRYTTPTANPEPRAAVALQIYLEKITATLAPYQNQFLTSQQALKELKSFGYWCPRRCDVYVVSYQPGYLAERLEIAAMLWKHHISADVMYEAAFRDAEIEDYIELCQTEGILFLVHAKPRVGGSPVYKVKSVLRGTETEVQPSELVSFLQQHIAEQKRYDATLSGGQGAVESSPIQPVAEKPAPAADTLVVLPNDVKKARKSTKGLYGNKAYDSATALKNAMPGIRTIAVEVTTAVFDELAKNSNWLTSEDALRTIAAGLPTQHAGYAQQIREAVLRQKAEGQRYVLLYGIRQDRIALLTLA
ncbi:Serine/threonine-protein kinase [Dichomitus squalens LYAD-421 SS1]|uniref:non-specific serine/threonine protein kinase n=1 Tax=Dichomitus squalens (strain LYAD-421) TaxID=732165 RepID=R7T110_DICSQ|nr:Serine/threonine-protein kinase [Dichomitus squalens LYAD-421 SS1]EJF61645.1 Serine/threonine-protein kinase [Dichomitus squalens LYAD-421 SS1]